jgi:hypothetical protein
MPYSTARLAKLQQQAIADYQRGLLTKSQLVNLIHRLDRISRHAV